ncbi:MAG: hypothetical protein Q4C13_02395 [Clostridia bacterium]|nr:hypothetical protein [Clostridia bacterium]
MAYDDLSKIVEFLMEAERRADEKIASLQYSKAKIRLARDSYENKMRAHPHAGDTRVQRFPRRVIMLSDTVETPTLDMLWNYLGQFYDRLEPAQREAFAFEDLAGVYTENGISRLFAVCIRYTDTEGLKILPEGDYLCADCTGENRADKLHELLRIAKRDYAAEPGFTIQQIVISGILQWNYQAQVFLGGAGAPPPGA